MDNIQAVAFDIDGTLYANSTLYSQSVGFALSHMRFIHIFNAVRTAIRANGTIVDNLFDYQAQQVAKIYRSSIADARANIDNIIYTTWMEKIAAIQLLDGVYMILQYLQDKGIPCGIISDFPTAQKMARWDIAEYFQVVIESEKCGTLKPHSKPFHLLSDQLGIKTKHILYIGNSFQNDIIGAYNVGLPALLLTPRKRTGATMPQYTSRKGVPHLQCTNYQQIMEYLATLFE